MCRMMTAEPQTESERILREYERREREIADDFYSLAKPANLFNHQGQQRAVLAALRKSGMLPLADRRILDIGCGPGRWLSHFETLEAPRVNLSAIELDPRRAAVARERFPGADIRVGDASRLPWGDESFDLVSQSTVFTSILDPGMRAAVAAEMLRVLKPRGIIIWYDFLFDNPRNANVRGVRKREIARLFLGCSVRLNRMTLAPPIARRIVPFSWPLARALEQLRVLN
ncbi:MAG TPA: class I SAM-dependent methyltransferase, partial [Pirellulales bacterium]|nr:class I SAM-dependent methyltransferase [Pirellulales bacterium]